jgi:excisionase family DNA binding protein
MGDEEFPIRDWRPSSPEQQFEVTDWRGWRVLIVLFFLGMKPRQIENLVSDPYMTTDQVARYLGVHPETVRRLTREVPRVLHGVSVGGVWRYKKSQVDQDIAQWTQQRRQYYTRRRWEINEETRGRRRLKRLGLLEDDEE